MRKGNALVKLGKTLLAVKEYELAHELAPDDAAIQKDLDKLKDSII